MALKGPYSLNTDFEHLNPLNNDSVHLNQGLTISLKKTDYRTLKKTKKNIDYKDLKEALSVGVWR